MAPIRAVKRPGADTAPKVSMAGSRALAEAAGDLKKEKAAERKEHREGANRHVLISISIFVCLGLFQIGINAFWLSGIETEVAEIIEAEGEDAIDENFIMILRVIYWTRIGVASLFLVCAGTFFKFPLTSSFVALITFVISEIISMILNPFLLLDYIMWIIRAFIFGLMVQSVNNAGYLRFVRAGGREKPPKD